MYKTFQEYILECWIPLQEFRSSSFLKRILAVRIRIVALLFSIILHPTWAKINLSDLNSLQKIHIKWWNIGVKISFVSCLSCQLLKIFCKSTVWDKIKNFLNQFNQSCINLSNSTLAFFTAEKRWHFELSMACKLFAGFLKWDKND